MHMRRARGPLVLLLLAVLLVGPVATPRQAAAQAPACAAGEWVSSDLGASLTDSLAALAPGAQAQDVSGALRLTLDADGAYDARFEDIAFMVSGLGFGGSQGATLRGSIRGVVREVEPGLLVTEVSEGTLMLTLTLFGFGSTVDLPIPTGAGDPSPYECDGDRLQLSLVNAANTAVTATFTRVR